jgi:hypothetical protein
MSFYEYWVKHVGIHDGYKESSKIDQTYICSINIHNYVLKTSNE